MRGHLLGVGGHLYNTGALDPRVFGPVRTTDATITTIASFAPADNTTRLFIIIVEARIATGGAGACYYFVVACRAESGVSLIGGDPHASDITNEEAPLAGATCVVTASGANILVRGTGVAATNIDWYVKVLPYV